MLAALVQGERDPEVLADLARGTLRTKLPALREALTGWVQSQHVVLISQILAHADFLEQAIVQVQAEIERCLPAYEDASALLQTIPGVRAVAAAAILAEVCPDMSRFPSAGHLASWAGLCPNNHAECREADEGSRQPRQRLVARDHTRGANRHPCSPWRRGSLPDIPANRPTPTGPSSWS